MNMEIVQLVNEYNISNRKADFEFYQRFLDIVKRTYGLDGYLNELIYISKEDYKDPKYEKYTKGMRGLFGQAGYEHETGNLVIYAYNIERDKEHEVSKGKFEGTSSVIMYNLLVLQTLLHEIEHAKQYKLKDSGTDMESELIRLTDVDGPETNESYEYSFVERLAELKSIGFILDMYEQLGISDQRIYDYFNKEYFDAALRGYHFEDEKGFYASEEAGFLVAPTVKYLGLHGGDLVKLSELALSIEGDDRIIYGLPISVEEYKALCNTSESFKM